MILKDGAWVPRYPGVLKGSVDPLPYITESAENPTGIWLGTQNLVSNLLKYLSGRSS